MVSGAAVDDALSRARRLPSLRVGLHLVLVDGRPALPPVSIPDLVDADGRLRRDLTRFGRKIFLSTHARRQLAAEIEAQFEAFRATGLTLDHVNAHHHFHVHPTVSNLVVDIGKRYGMRAVRVPREPVRLLARIDPKAHPRRDFIAAPWTALLAKRVLRQGFTAPDRTFGRAWSGAMIESRISSILQNLPDGLTEIYCHPATRGGFAGAAPGYRYVDELAGLTAPGVRASLQRSGAATRGFADFARG